MADESPVTPTGVRSPAVAGDLPEFADTGKPEALLEPDPGPDANNTPAAARQSSLGLSRGDMQFAAICGGLILLLLLAHWGRHAWLGPKLVEIDRLPAKAYEFQLDINSATWVEWMQLDGIGDVLARRIVSNRDEHGPFASVDDVQRVPGVGPKTLDTIRPHLLCSDCPSPDRTP